MKLTCALCGRPMAHAAFTIGAMSVGPQCGRKAGFAALSHKKSGHVRFVGRLRAGQRAADDAQMALELEVPHA